MMTGGGPAFPRPTIALFWNSGVAEKVEYPWPERTLLAKRGLPRPSDRNDRHHKPSSMGDAAAIKYGMSKADGFANIEELGRILKKVKAELVTE